MDAKTAMRHEARQRRRQLANRAALSDRIVQRLFAQSAVAEARTMAWYAAHQSEVLTRSGIELAWTRRQGVLLPYCDGDALRFVAIDDWQQLAAGRFGILEPRPELRTMAGTGLDAVDVVLVPGVAFDRHGARLGQGGGFYDRLLAGLSPSTIVIGLAFDCQIFPLIPTGPHDQQMHWVATETDWIRGGRPTVDA